MRSMLLEPMLYFKGAQVQCRKILCQTPSQRDKLLKCRATNLRKELTKFSKGPSRPSHSCECALLATTLDQPWVTSPSPGKKETKECSEEQWWQMEVINSSWEEIAMLIRLRIVRVSAKTLIKEETVI